MKSLQLCALYRTIEFALQEHAVCTAKRLQLYCSTWYNLVCMTGARCTYCEAPAALLFNIMPDGLEEAVLPPQLVHSVHNLQSTCSKGRKTSGSMQHTCVRHNTCQNSPETQVSIRTCSVLWSALFEPT